MDDVTKDEIAASYGAMMDSVGLIGKLCAKTSLNAEERDTLNRNIQHLKIMLAKGFWSDENLLSVREAINSGELRLTA